MKNMDKKKLCQDFVKVTDRCKLCGHVTSADDTNSMCMFHFSATRLKKKLGPHESLIKKKKSGAEEAEIS